MGFFEYMGFAPLKAGGPDYGARPGMARFAQLELIRDQVRFDCENGEVISFKLNAFAFRPRKKIRVAIETPHWSEYTRHEAAEPELCKWLLRYWKVSSLRFVTKGQATKIIGTLKAMKSRAA